MTNETGPIKPPTTKENLDDIADKLNYFDNLENPENLSNKELYLVMRQLKNAIGCIYSIILENYNNKIIK